jgi:hypothetical protein
MEAETPQALSVIFNEFCFDAKNVGIWASWDFEQNSFVTWQPSVGKTLQLPEETIRFSWSVEEPWDENLCLVAARYVHIMIICEKRYWTPYLLPQHKNCIRAPWE